MGAPTTTVVIIVTVIAIIIILLTTTTTTIIIIKRCTKADVEVGAVWILERRMTYLYIHQERIQWGHSNIRELLSVGLICLVSLCVMQINQATNMNPFYNNKFYSWFHVLIINYKI